MLDRSMAIATVRNDWTSLMVAHYIAHRNQSQPAIEDGVVLRFSGSATPDRTFGLSLAVLPAVEARRSPPPPTTRASSTLPLFPDIELKHRPTLRSHSSRRRV